MKRRAYLATTGGLLAAIAGCTGDSSSQPQTDSTQPKPTTGTDQSTATTQESLSAADIEFPPGYAESTVENWDSATRAHRDALADQSYTHTFSSDDETYGTEERTTKVEPGDEEVLISTVRDEDAYRDEHERHLQRDRYITDRGYNKDIVDEGDPRYYVGGQTTFSEARYRLLWTYISAFDYTFDGVVEADGETRLRYVSEELTDSAAENLSDEHGETREAELVVRRDGLVRESYVLMGEVGETESFVRFSASIEAVGETSVEKPDWVEKAKTSDE